MTPSFVSGGSSGSDLYWAEMAVRLGHEVIHWSFPGYRSDAPADHLYELDDALLSGELVSRDIKNTASILGKTIPSNPYTAKLLGRNRMIAVTATSMYAIVEMIDGEIQGGVAWTISMFQNQTSSVDYSYYCWVFDQTREQWYKWDGCWVEIDLPPQPSNIWAGIGTRKLNESGKIAIQKLMVSVKN